MIDLNINYVESLAVRFLPLDTWGFVESLRTESMLIYNSQWCRLRCYINIDRYSKDLVLSYGRLHAIADQSVMKWKGEDCRCWYEGGNLRILLLYLDGLTPEKANKASASLKLFDDFSTSVLASHPEINSLELGFMEHAMMWEHYGVRFFELFDLRRPDLWDDYIGFLKEYYRLYYEELDADLAHRGQKRIPHEIPLHKRC